MLAYELYATDALRLLVNNVADTLGGRVMQTRFAEIIDVLPQETRTEEEVRSKIEEKLRAI